jgi:hypothetical protein
VPGDIAEKMKPWQLMGFSVIAGELRSGDFDWKGMRWREKKLRRSDAVGLFDYPKGGS